MITIEYNILFSFFFSISRSIWRGSEALDKLKANLSSSDKDSPAGASPELGCVTGQANASLSTPPS